LKETKQSIEKVPAWKENEEDHGARESLSAKAYRCLLSKIIAPKEYVSIGSKKYRIAIRFACRMGG
jgi:hypothetical protein